MSFTQPKFKVGQTVKAQGDRDQLAGEVIDMLYSSETGWTYKITSRYFDPEENKMVEGQRMCSEKELVLVEAKKEAHE